MNRRVFFLAAVLAAVSLSFGAWRAQAADTSTLEIVSKNGVHVFAVEMAVTDV
jgi:hypothetical protein